MSNKKKHIDDIFSEGLMNYSEQPPVHIWNSIESEILAKKKRKTVLIFWQGLSAAAIITLVFFVSILHKPDTKNTTALNNSKTIEVSNQKTEEQITDIKLDNEEFISAKDRDFSKTSNLTYSAIAHNFPNNNNFLNRKSIINKHSEGRSINKNEQAIHENTLSKLKNLKPDVDSNYDLTSKIYTLSVSHKETNKEFLSPFVNTVPENKETENNRGNIFSLGGSVSPTYAFRNSSEDNSANQENGITSLSGGLNISIKTTKRLHIETGVIYAQVGQKFSNSYFEGDRSIAFLANAETLNMDTPNNSNDNLKNSMGNIITTTNNSDLPMANISTEKINSFDLNSAKVSTNAYKVNIQQELDYIEIPFNLKYFILDKKYKLSLTSGVSSNFLIGNGAYALNDGSKDRLGSIEGINKVSYSATFGFGIKAPLSKSFDFNIEPRFKYFFNSVTSSSQYDFKPYSFGVFSGVSYKF